ncbi:MULTISPECIES: alkaline phosphatase [Haloarcula]|uniref:Alkaline phosphatase n=1 Tax=Haloarcula pellucida TaxID=1427151 RepID=A0A830GH24_9EURY|nr:MULTISPECIES: alkaline phosphatase [Halomicroarcula]MBX0347215.1 alkaline phosphatase [Halomicroarcula pellucida]MDS0276909.1 alkaline phosphatase [Halomicroarcula sp. S1AR25-4]GGN87562.1 alkaline phosphatase [Halomicroarcula pellucida]
MQRRQFITALGATGLLGATGAASAQANGKGESKRNGRNPNVDGGIENVIVLIGDGMGFDPIEVTSVVHDDLAMQSMTGVGYTRTNSRSGEVTDSAAAGTALATGLKAYNRQVSVYGDGDEDDVTPLATQLEVAQWLGKATGLVSTTRITHATPAAYASHIYDRGQEAAIAAQLVDSGVDVLFGGGRHEFDEETLGRAENEGYELLTDAGDLGSASSEKLLGLFDDSHVTYTLDRDDAIPALPEMTATAVDHLEQDDDGFFLMVEGGRIDHAEHGNDTQTTVAETKEFDEVVNWALDYVEDRDDTLVVVTSDHETGGMATGDGYGSPIETDAIANAEASNGAIAAAIEDGADVREAVEGHVDVDLTDEDVEQIEDGINSDNPYGLLNELGAVISDHLGVAWASNAHTGPAQPVMAAGPNVDPYDGWVHHVDLSATLTALLLFGRLDEVSETECENWERTVAKKGPRGTRDAYMALQYVGPVADDVTEALDVDDNGVVDYRDVVAILDGEVPKPVTAKK